MSFQTQLELEAYEKYHRSTLCQEARGARAEREMKGRQVQDPGRIERHLSFSWLRSLLHFIR